MGSEERKHDDPNRRVPINIGKVAGGILDPQPFHLGIDGELWIDDLRSLFVPIREGSRTGLLVFREKDGVYNVVTIKGTKAVGSILMVSSLVHETIERLKDGNQDIHD